MYKVTTKLNVFPWDAPSDLCSFFKDIKECIAVKEITLKENNTICYLFHVYLFIDEVLEL